MMKRLFFISVSSLLVVACSIIMVCAWQIGSHSLQKGHRRLEKRCTRNAPLFSSLEHKPLVAVVAGATGYIGRAVVQECIARNYTTLALVRSIDAIQSPQGRLLYQEAFHGAQILEVEVTNTTHVLETISSFLTQHQLFDTHNLYFISCLASPVGTKKEAFAIDYQATLNILHTAQTLQAQHFSLLSAFCVRRPLLQLQQAKLQMEAALQAQNRVSWTIIRPTAFLKSISGQFESIQQDGSYVLFGNGDLTRCNPISQQDLAHFIVATMIDPNKHNHIYNVGGPDEPLTPKMLGEKMFAALGKTPKFVYAPAFLFDFIIHSFQSLADFTHSQALEDAAEYARIGKYYAVEDMLTERPEEKYGHITVQDHYNKIAAQGQDPFTPIRATSLIAKVLETIPLLIIIIFITITIHGQSSYIDSA